MDVSKGVQKDSYDVSMTTIFVGIKPEKMET